MKKYIIALCLATGLLGGAAYALNNGLPQPSAVRDLLNYGGASGIRSAQLGTQVVDKKVQVMKARYDYASVGGSTAAAINLKDVDGKDAVLPANAVVKNVLIDVLTVPATAAGSHTISLGINTASDLGAALQYQSWFGRLNGIPNGGASTMVKVTAAAPVTATIGTAPGLNAGKFNVFIEYYVSD